MRLIAATVLMLLGTSSVADQKPPKPNKHAKAEVVRHEVDETSVAVHVSWTTRDIEMVRRHYAPKYRDLPPGLRKKYQRTGTLPPGWRKKMQPFPVALERKCAPIPAGYRRGVIDAHAVIYDSRGVIVDVAVLF
jgi:hypothetical protein